MENEIKHFKADLFKLAWFMRGGLSLDDMFATCHEDREVMGGVIKDNLDTAKKTGQPFF